MNCLNTSIFAVLLFGFTIEQTINANMDFSILERYEDNNAMVTVALFEKLNWMIKQLGKVYQENRQITIRLQEYKRILNIPAFKFEIRQLLRQQDIKMEKVLLEMQREVVKKLDMQTDLLTNASLDVANLKSFDMTSFKQHRNWQTILRRQDGSQDFNRTWNEYKTGFGPANGEFFIGLETLHATTTYADPQELLIVIQDFNNQTRYAKYSDFVIGSESEKYKITKIGKYQGDADDHFSQHLNCKFSTYDNDNDNTTSNCAKTYNGGWWFSSCYNSHLTGTYYHQPSLGNGKSVIWGSGQNNSLRYAEMMIRPK